MLSVVTVDVVMLNVVMLKCRGTIFPQSVMKKKIKLTPVLNVVGLFTVVIF
jgi:hypothetical protein